MIHGLLPELPRSAGAGPVVHRYSELDDPALKVWPIPRDWDDTTMAHLEPEYYALRWAVPTDDHPEPVVLPLPVRSSDELAPDWVFAAGEPLPVTAPLPLLEATAVFRADELVAEWRGAWPHTTRARRVHVSTSPAEPVSNRDAGAWWAEGPR